MEHMLYVLPSMVTVFNFFAFNFFRFLVVNTFLLSRFLVLFHLRSTANTLCAFRFNSSLSAPRSEVAKRLEGCYLFGRSSSLRSWGWCWSRLRRVGRRRCSPGRCRSWRSFVVHHNNVDVAPVGAAAQGGLVRRQGHGVLLLSCSCDLADPVHDVVLPLRAALVVERVVQGRAVELQVGVLAPGLLRDHVACDCHGARSGGLEFPRKYFLAA